LLPKYIPKSNAVRVTSEMADKHTNTLRWHFRVHLWSGVCQRYSDRRYSYNHYFARVCVRFGKGRVCMVLYPNLTTLPYIPYPTLHTLPYPTVADLRFWIEGGVSPGGPPHPSPPPPLPSALATLHILPYQYPTQSYRTDILIYATQPQPYCTLPYPTLSHTPTITLHTHTLLYPIYSTLSIPIPYWYLYPTLPIPYPTHTYPTSPIPYHTITYFTLPYIPYPYPNLP